MWCGLSSYLTLSTPDTFTVEIEKRKGSWGEGWTPDGLERLGVRRVEDRVC